MITHYSRQTSLIICSFFMLLQGALAFADSTSQFNQYIQTTHVHRAHMEGQLGLQLTGDAFLERGPSRAVHDPAQFTQNIQAFHTHRAGMEGKLGLDPSLDPFPQATCYYDDKVDHIEHVLMTFDEIDRGI